MLVIAPCFFPSADPAALMLASARHHGLEPVLYGIGQPFVPHGADAQVVRLLDALDGRADELTLVTDAADVLFFADALEIEWKFKEFGARLVMSTERECWPSNTEVFDALRGRSAHGYDFINAGQYIGETAYIRHCLRHLISNYRGRGGMDNSQPWWPLALVRGELDFALDSGCELFQTMSGGAEHHVEVVDANGDYGKDRRVRNTVTGSCPSTLHWNGSSNNREPYRELSRRIYGTS